MSYPELAYEILSLYIRNDQIPANDLRRIINKSFEPFRSTGMYLNNWLYSGYSIFALSTMIT
jgi:predicted transcriptional regulator